MAAAEAIENVSGETAGIKWVNDVFLRGRKVCGILTEAAPDGRGGLAWVIPGIGINVTPPPGGYPPEIASTAGAVFPCAAPEDAAARLAVETIDRLIALYKAMPAQDFHVEYARRMTLLGREVTLPGGARALVTGLDKDFRLLVRSGDRELGLGLGRDTLKEGAYMNENRQTIVNKTVKTGISFGSALAMVISYTTWHSVGWAILHGLLSWVYVIYFVIKY